MNIDLRKYIINNFKDDNVADIEKSINMSIDSKEEDPLIGMGVLFELAWVNSTKELKDEILSNIKKGITSNVQLFLFFYFNAFNHIININATINITYTYKYNI